MQLLAQQQRPPRSAVSMRAYAIGTADRAKRSKSPYPG